MIESHHFRLKFWVGRADKPRDLKGLKGFNRADTDFTQKQSCTNMLWHCLADCVGGLGLQKLKAAPERLWLTSGNDVYLLVVGNNGCRCSYRTWKSSFRLFCLMFT